MVEEKQNKIIEKINNSKDVKRIKYLKKYLINNKEYNNLISLSKKENSNIIEIRKKLFLIKEYKEYVKLYNKIKLEFLKINNIIISIIKE